VTVAVRPPVGNPVSAGFTPEFENLADDDLISDEDREEVARGLAASAALQVKAALGDDVPRTARASSAVLCGSRESARRSRPAHVRFDCRLAGRLAYNPPRSGA